MTTTDQAATAEATSKPTGRRDRDASVALAVVAGTGLFAAIAVLVSTASGIGVTPDGVGYLSMAEQVRSGAGPYPLVDDLAPTHYPPGWSVLVGIIAGVTSADDVMGVGRWVQALLAAALPLVTFATMRSVIGARRDEFPEGERALRSLWLPVVTAIAVGCSYALFTYTIRALSETLFVILVITVAWALTAALRRESERLLIVAIVLTALAIVTRYLGVMLLVPIAAAALRIPGTTVRRLARVAVAGGIAVLPVAVWTVLAPPYDSIPHLGSSRPDGIEDLLESLRRLGNVLVLWSGTPSLLLLLAGAAIVVITIAVPLVTRPDDTRTATSEPLGPRVMRPLITANPWLLFIATYGLFVVAWRWRGGREVLTRYWLPYWFIGLMLVVVCVALVWSRRTVRALFAVLATLAVVNMAQMVVAAERDRSAGLTYNAVEYQDTDLFDEVLAADPALVLTNDEYLATFHLRIVRGTDATILRMPCPDPDVEFPVVDGQTLEPDVVLLFGGCASGATGENVAERLGASSTIVDDGVGVAYVIGDGD